MVLFCCLQQQASVSHSTQASQLKQQETPGNTRTINTTERGSAVPSYLELDRLAACCIGSSPSKRREEALYCRLVDWGRTQQKCYATHDTYSPYNKQECHAHRTIHLPHTRPSRPASYSSAPARERSTSICGTPLLSSSYGITTEVVVARTSRQ